MELLRIENLCKVYGKGENQVVALDHVSLTVEKGEFTAIIGSSGSGKSTLLHIIGGVDVPTSGKVYLDGPDVDVYKRQVAMSSSFFILTSTINYNNIITNGLLL